MGLSRSTVPWANPKRDTCRRRHTSVRRVGPGPPLKPSTIVNTIWLRSGLHVCQVPSFPWPFDRCDARRGHNSHASVRCPEDLEPVRRRRPVVSGPAIDDPTGAQPPTATAATIPIHRSRPCHGPHLNSYERHRRLRPGIGPTSYEEHITVSEADHFYPLPRHPATARQFEGPLRGVEDHRVGGNPSVGCALRDQRGPARREAARTPRSRPAQMPGWSRCPCSGCR